MDSKADWYETAVIRSRQRKRFKKLAWLFGCLIPLVACGAITVVFVYQLYNGTQSELLSLDFGEGYRIRVWVEQDGWLEPEFDLDHRPAVYYEVTRFGSVVEPKRFLTASWEPFRVSAAFADEGKLIGLNIYTVECQPGNGSRVFLEQLEDDRWFIGTFSDYGQQRWTNRYERLVQENPDWLSCF